MSQPPVGVVLFKNTMEETGAVDAIVIDGTGNVFASGRGLHNLLEGVGATPRVWSPSFAALGDLVCAGVLRDEFAVECYVVQ